MGKIGGTVVLLLDSVRKDVFSFYGGEYEFPNIDRLANNGILYTNAKGEGWTLASANAIADGWGRKIEKSVLIADNGVLNQSKLSQCFERYVKEWPVVPVDIAPYINWWLDAGYDLVFFWTSMTHAPYYSWGEERYYEEQIEEHHMWDEGATITYPIPHLQQSVEYIWARYLGAIRAIDKYVIPNIEAGKIILLSDHGECLGEHKLFGHVERKYPELVDIPLIVYGIGYGTVEREVHIGELYDIVVDVMKAEAVEAEDEEVVRQQLRALGYIGDDSVAHVAA